jgi:hypothetical protein
VDEVSVAFTRVELFSSRTQTLERVVGNTAAQKRASRQMECRPAHDDEHVCRRKYWLVIDGITSKRLPQSMLDVRSSHYAALLHPLMLRRVH